MSPLGFFQAAPVIDFGGFSAVGGLALIAAGVAISLFLVLLVARDVARQPGVRRARTAERTRAAAAAHLSHAT